MERFFSTAITKFFATPASPDRIVIGEGIDRGAMFMLRTERTQSADHLEIHDGSEPRDAFTRGFSMMANGKGHSLNGEYQMADHRCQMRDDSCQRARDESLMRSGVSAENQNSEVRIEMRFVKVKGADATRQNRGARVIGMSDVPASRSTQKAPNRAKFESTQSVLPDELVQESSKPASPEQTQFSSPSAPMHQTYCPTPWGSS